MFARVYCEVLAMLVLQTQCHCPGFRRFSAAGWAWGQAERQQVGCIGGLHAEWRTEGLALGSSQYPLERWGAGRTLNIGSSAGEGDGEVSPAYTSREVGKQNWEPPKTGAKVALKLNEMQEELTICLRLGVFGGVSNTDNVKWQHND